MPARLSGQLGIEDVSRAKRHTERRSTPFEHQEVIPGRTRSTAHP
ncbi:hypothetical protein ACWDTT_35885 [Streptosporangium sandarakinum]